MPRDYRIDWGYTSALNTFLVCFSLSPGIPLLNWVCALSLLSYYLVEKYKLYEHSKKPPRMSKGLATISIGCLFAGLVMHLVFAISMLGNSGVFMASESEIDANDFVRLQEDPTVGNCTLTQGGRNGKDSQ